MLGAPFTIKTTSDLTETKPLGQWLKGLNNPVEVQVEFLDGAVRKAISKEAIYVPVTKGVPLVDFIKSTHSG